MNEELILKTIEKLAKQKLTFEQIYDLNFLQDLEGRLLFVQEVKEPECYAFVEWLKRLTDGEPWFATYHTRIEALLRCLHLWKVEK